MADLMLYNTLTRRKERFEPIDNKNIRLYVCGPTVYDFAHIGNARPVIVFDVLFRLLRHLYGADHVTYTRNITDVDDKINARAVRDFPGLPLNEAIRRVTETTNAQFQADVAALGCLEPTHQPRATEHIAGMIDIIARLVARGYAYIAQGSEGREVLFSINKMPAYGALSNRKLEENIAGARVAVEAHKQNPGDFVLWKESAGDEPGWPATFDGVPIHGRPGWHIECSAMSMATLLEPFGGGLSCDDPTKNVFDIHGGGIDLIFPHHENEIAQSCCALGTPRMANFWMHNGFLQVEGQKMSKSLGNFVTIDDLLNTAKFGGLKWPGEVLRLAMLKTHYRQPIDWTSSGLRVIFDEFYFLRRVSAEYKATEADNDFLNALYDDLNIHEAIVRLHELARLAKAGDIGAGGRLRFGFELLGLGKDLSRHDVVILPPTDPELAEFVQHPRSEADVFRDWLSIVLRNDPIARLKTAIANTHWSVNVDRQISIFEDFSRYIEPSVEVGALFSLVGKIQEINSRIDVRNAARASKNWVESDRIRDELHAMGIVLKDGKDEAGNPVTTWEVKR